MLIHLNIVLGDIFFYLWVIFFSWKHLYQGDIYNIRSRFVSGHVFFRYFVKETPCGGTFCGVPILLVHLYLQKEATRYLGRYLHIYTGASIYICVPTYTALPKSPTNGPFLAPQEPFEVMTRLHGAPVQWTAGSVADGSKKRELFASLISFGIWPSGGRRSATPPVENKSCPNCCPLTP